MFTCEMFQVCNHCFDFFSRYGIWAQELCCCWLPKQWKKVEEMGETKLHCSCMFERDTYLRLRATIQAFSLSHGEKG